jgi:CO/xanthine dehydrogenase Mo-binding subunit
MCPKLRWPSLRFKDAPLKVPAAYAIVGKSIPRVDIPPKVTARFDYMQDFCVDGMLHGRVVRPLAIGANLESVDESSVINTPGFVKVVREGKFLGVIATTEWDAIQAARAEGDLVELGGATRTGTTLGLRTLLQSEQRRSYV